MNSPNEAIAKACCADLYQSDLAKMILGDTLHPGGLGLTNRLGRLMGIKRGTWLVDLASARGNSALAVSRVFHCNVVGVEFGADAVREARIAAVEAPQPASAYFVRGDAESPPLRDGAFDHALCECSMSLFTDKAEAVAGTARILRPGGRFGISDVTLQPGALPEELRGDIGHILCLTGALPVEGYVRLMEEGGFRVAEQEDASEEILKILDEVDAKLGAYLALQRLGRGGEAGPLADAPRLVANVRELVASGRLGYWLFVGERRG